MIGGNVTAIVQVKDEGKKNAIGERIHEWSDAVSLFGYLDYQGGQNSYNTYDAKVQESTHIFINGFNNYSELSRWRWDPNTITNGCLTCQNGDKCRVTSGNARMVINGLVYDILLIDDPMGMHQHLEIYLKYTGGGLGVE